MKSIKVAHKLYLFGHIKSIYIDNLLFANKVCLFAYLFANLFVSYKLFHINQFYLPQIRFSSGAS